MPDPVRRRPAESTRVEAFSDGVFAVAITLLVLDLRAPEGRGEFLTELLAQWQSYVAYLAAFLVIGVVWMTHHSLFVRIRGVDTGLIRHNLLQLLLTALMPFAASVVSSAMRVGTRGDQIVAVVLFALVSLLLSLSWYWLCWYVERRPELLVDAASASIVRRDRLHQPIAMIVSVLAAVAALLSPILALVLLGLLPLYYLFSIQRSEAVEV